MVIKDNGEYKMWFQGRGLSFYNQYGLGYATSPDGVSWEKYADNPVMTPGEPGEWDSQYRGQIALIKDGSIFKMWFSGGPQDGPWQTGYATSLDGINWEIYAENPVLESGGAGSWDEMESDGPTVIKDGSVYKMWYHGCNADYSVCSIGYATSNDGISWTKYADNPVIESTAGTWDESGLGWPRVIKYGATYQMWYHSNSNLGYATSLDGIQWNKYAGNPVLSIGWDGAGIGVSTILLDGDTYILWTSSGSSAAGTRGIGYLESVDGIIWTQPESNPVMVSGEAGVIIDADYENNHIRALTLSNTVITLTVSKDEAIKATLVGITNNQGWFRSWEHNEDWSPNRPDILPGDHVSATTADFATDIDPIGEVNAKANNDTDKVEGSIHAPWLAPESLDVLCEIYTEPAITILDKDVAADGGSFQCDFAGLADIVGNLGGKVGYLEPDGDMVSVNFMGPYMEVFYGVEDGVGGIYAIGHSFTITVTNSVGSIKATTAITTTEGGGWWGHGFVPSWMGLGECCDWSPDAPDIQPGDWVYFHSDDGYENQVQVGSIFGAIDVEGDSITGPIFTPWLDQTLEVWCHPQTFWPYVYRQSSAEPDGSVPYFCEWPTSIPDVEPWDIQPDDKVMVHYREPDGDQVYRMMIAEDGAPAPGIYLPMLKR